MSCGARQLHLLVMRPSVAAAALVLLILTANESFAIDVVNTEANSSPGAQCVNRDQGGIIFRTTSTMSAGLSR